MESNLLMGLGVALGLGLLVGMQREWKASGIAGVRTFALISLLGAVLSILNEGIAPWATAAGLVALTALLVLANMAKLATDDNDVGLTTEVAALLMFAVGAAAGQGFIVPAVVVGGVTAVLLHWKEPIHSFIDSIGEKDFKGIAQLVLIGLVILPILPDETYGPYEVLNPYRIWWMVVLIVGISLSAYLAQRALGNHIGSILAGLLGGMISSTATTVSYARRTVGRSGVAWIGALVILIAGTVVNLRALLEVGVVAPRLVGYVVGPLLALTLGMAMLCVVAYVFSRGEEIDGADPKNPAQLKVAMAFGLLYAVVLVIVAMVNAHFGDRGLYLVAAVSGLTDINAITLSAAQMFKHDRIAGGIAWRIILIAILSNCAFKTVAIWILGSRMLATRVTVFFLLTLAMGMAILLFWPDWIVRMPAPPPEGVTQ